MTADSRSASQNTALRDLEVVILAGGQGTRLQPAWSDGPKILAPIEGKAFLDHLLNYLFIRGARNVVLCLGHQQEAVVTHLARSDLPKLNIRTSIEHEPLGTGGALRQSLDLLTQDTALVMNGDAWIRADLVPFQHFHADNQADLSILLAPVESSDRFGAVECNAAGQIQSFSEKQSATKEAGITWVNTGVYLMRRSFITGLPTQHPLSLEYDVFPKACASHRAYGFKSDAPFLDIGTPDAYARSAAFLRGDRPS